MLLANSTWRPRFLLSHAVLIEWQQLRKACLHSSAFRMYSALFSQLCPRGFSYMPSSQHFFSAWSSCCTAEICTLLITLLVSRLLSLASLIDLYLVLDIGHRQNTGNARPDQDNGPSSPVSGSNRQWCQIASEEYARILEMDNYGKTCLSQFFPSSLPFTAWLTSQSRRICILANATVNVLIINIHV